MKPTLFLELTNGREIEASCISYTKIIINILKNKMNFIVGFLRIHPLPQLPPNFKKR